MAEKTNHMRGRSAPPSQKRRSKTFERLTGHALTSTMPSSAAAENWRAKAHEFGTRCQHANGPSWQARQQPQHRNRAGLGTEGDLQNRAGEARARICACALGITFEARDPICGRAGARRPSTPPPARQAHVRPGMMAVRRPHATARCSADACARTLHAARPTRF